MLLLLDYQSQIMNSEQISTPLMNTAVLEIQTQTSNDESTFIKRYNSVVNCYNRNVDEDKPKLQIIVGNPFIFKLSQILQRPLYAFLFAISLLFIPILNIFCLCCLIIYLYYLKRQNKKHLRNISRVDDPFSSFYYLPQMCQNLGKHFAIINLTQNQLQGFTFNQELRQKLSQKLKEKKSNKKDEALTVLIYDQYFYDSFYLYRQEFYKTLIWTFVGLLLNIFSIIVYLKIFNLI